ncbi:hypothetical protein NKH14_01035 [Mesorhizobium sp. M1380]|uniref:hypothetical protein n=1 Tax=Mesorhizobium sp. M1380 TaxID=2957093 RepID=UPI0033376447
MKEFGSGRALPPFSPLKRLAVFSAKLGVTELSWCCKNGMERESLTEADEGFSWRERQLRA